MRDLLRRKVVDSLALIPPSLTRRAVHLPAVCGKAFAVIGKNGNARHFYAAEALRAG